MGTMKQNPRYNVVSMRVSDEEKQMLNLITAITRKSVSDIMREALRHLEPGIGDIARKRPVDAADKKGLEDESGFYR
jgi:predicted transcriptional regulator